MRGKISTFCPVNWNKLKNKQGTTYILQCEVCKFHEGFEGYMRPEQNVRYVFNDFLKFYYTFSYYTPMYYEVNLNDGTTYR
jgi:hypothetical protein